MDDLKASTGDMRVADATELARLAALDPLAYDREREAAAERLGVRVSTLDTLVAALRPKREAGEGRAVALAMPEPWPESVATGALLNDLAAALRRHVVLLPAAADCIAAWILHSWVHDRFQHSPRLSITSPAPRCGKSTLLEVLRLTCRRSLKADSISSSAVFRTVEALRPVTLLVDEADSFLGVNEELRGILNSGFEASGEVIRVAETPEGWRPVRFATFAPVALAGIGRLPTTLEDRALPVLLQRKAVSETVVKLRAPGARKALHDIARRCARWAGDQGSHLMPDPAIPDALGDREGDITVPLLSIADAAGGVWAHRLRRGLLEVFGRRATNEGDADTAALLLGDVRSIFDATGALRLPSADLVARLGAMEERPWAEWRQGKPITAPQLARVLAPFRVRPCVYRPAGAEVVVRGYVRDDFEPAWSRYLPPAAP